MHVTAVADGLSQCLGNGGQGANETMPNVSPKQTVNARSEYAAMRNLLLEEKIEREKSRMEILTKVTANVAKALVTKRIYEFQKGCESSVSKYLTYVDSE